MFAICIFIIVYTVFKTGAQCRKWKGVEKNPNFITSTTATGAVFFLMFGTRENKSFRIPEKCPFNRGDRMSNDVWTRRGTKTGKRERAHVYIGLGCACALAYTCVVNGQVWRFFFLPLILNAFFKFPRTTGIMSVHRANRENTIFYSITPVRQRKRQGHGERHYCVCVYRRINGVSRVKKIK